MSGLWERIREVFLPTSAPTTPTPSSVMKQVGGADELLKQAAQRATSLFGGRSEFALDIRRADPHDITSPILSFEVSHKDSGASVAFTALRDQVIGMRGRINPAGEKMVRPSSHKDITDIQNHLEDFEHNPLAFGRASARKKSPKVIDELGIDSSAPHTPTPTLASTSTGPHNPYWAPEQHRSSGGKVFPVLSDMGKTYPDPDQNGNGMVKMRETNRGPERDTRIFKPNNNIAGKTSKMVGPAVSVAVAGVAYSNGASAGQAVAEGIDAVLPTNFAKRKGLCHQWGEALTYGASSIGGVAAGVASSPIVTPAGGAVVGIATGMAIDSAGQTLTDIACGPN